MSFRRRRIAWLPLLLLLAAALAWFFWPRRADLRGFDAAAAGRLEARMWRHYYQREYTGLFRALYALSREQYHFSPWDSGRLAWHAAKSARLFQNSHSRDEAQAALPDLVRYYGIIRAQGSEEFEVQKAAALELDWWQLRREKAPPTQYGEIVAQVAEVLYGTSNESIRQSGLLRAEMMHYRDEHRETGMKEEDWRRVEEGLMKAFGLLKQGIVR